jgi:hypothetical protein
MEGGVQNVKKVEVVPFWYERRFLGRPKLKDEVMEAKSTLGDKDPVEGFMAFCSLDYEARNTIEQKDDSGNTHTSGR